MAYSRKCFDILPCCAKQTAGGDSRLGPRLVGQHAHDRVHRWVDSLDAGKMSVDDSTDDAFSFAMSTASPLGRSLPKLRHARVLPITRAGIITSSYRHRTSDVYAAVSLLILSPRKSARRHGQNAAHRQHFADNVDRKATFRADLRSSATPAARRQGKLTQACKLGIGVT